MGIVLQHRGVHAAELRARLFESCAGRQAAEEFSHAMNASGDHGGGEVVRATHHVDHHLCFARIGHGWFEHAHDRGGARAETFQANAPADNRWVFLKYGAPEAISENCGASSLGAVIAHVQQPAKDGVQAHHFEIITPNHSRLDSARLAETHHGKAEDGEVTELFDTLDAGP